MSLTLFAAGLGAGHSIEANNLPNCHQSRQPVSPRLGWLNRAPPTFCPDWAVVMQAPGELSSARVPLRSVRGRVPGTDGRPSCMLAWRGASPA